MPASKAHIRATTRFESKTYDKVTVRLRKDSDGLTREKIQQAADAAGESVNGYILEAVRQRIQRGE